MLVNHVNQVPFADCRLNDVKSRKSRKCCQPRTVFSRVFLRFERGGFCSVRGEGICSLFLSSFLFAMYGTRSVFFLVSNLFVACRTIHFPFASESSCWKPSLSNCLALPRRAIKPTRFWTQRWTQRLFLSANVVLTITIGRGKHLLPQKKIAAAQLYSQRMTVES